MVENAMLLTIRTVDGRSTYSIEAGFHRRQNANILTDQSPALVSCLLLQPSHTENDSFLNTIKSRIPAILYNDRRLKKRLLSANAMHTFRLAP